MKTGLFMKVLGGCSHVLKSTRDRHGPCPRWSASFPSKCARSHEHSDWWTISEPRTAPSTKTTSTRRWTIQQPPEATGVSTRDCVPPTRIPLFPVERAPMLPHRPAAEHKPVSVTGQRISTGLGLPVKHARARDQDSITCPTRG